MDAKLIAFMGENIITITFCLVLFKGLAEISPWKWDEKVIDVINNALVSFTKRSNRGD